MNPSPLVAALLRRENFLANPFESKGRAPQGYTGATGRAKGESETHFGGRESAVAEIKVVSSQRVTWSPGRA
jgi:hypothetical protein